MTHHFLLCFSIFVAFVLEAFFVEYSLEKSDLQTSVEKKIEELELAVAQCVNHTHTHTLSVLLSDSAPLCCVVLSSREKLDDNLVNAMETMDSEQGDDQSAASRPTLLFKIASKSKNLSQEGEELLVNT